MSTDMLEIMQRDYSKPRRSREAKTQFDISNVSETIFDNNRISDDEHSGGNKISIQTEMGKNCFSRVSLF